MNRSLLRVYFDPAEIGLDGYPYAWHKGELVSQKLVTNPDRTLVAYETEYGTPIKDLIRERDGHRCLRCGHPYEKGMGQWSPCDEHCTHGGPAKITEVLAKSPPMYRPADEIPKVEAEWRILTVHHLGEKCDCRWFMLVSLCQRCHLQVQAKVQMNRVFPWEHSEWFKVFAAGWYAWVYEDREITQEEAIERMDELLAYERVV